MKKIVTIIDTFGFFFRSFYAMPPLSNKDGFPTGLLAGFLNFISSMKRDFKTDYMLFALDAKGTTFRHDIDPNYKANRSPAPEDLLKQLFIAIEWIKQMGFASAMQDGFEADDIIATVAKLAVKEGYKVQIISHDKDLYQLICDDNILVYDAIKRKKMDEKACFEKYGVYPIQFIDYQSLLGDTADNIAGVKGIGKVTAEKLLKTYKTLDVIYKNLQFVAPSRIQKLLQQHKEEAFKSKKLVTLKDDVFNTINFKDLILPTNPLEKIVSHLYKYEMNAQLRILKAEGKLENIQISKTKEQLGLTFKAILINDSEKLFATISEIDSQTIVALDTETTGLNPYKDSLVGYSFALNDKEAFYVPFTHNYLGVPKQVSEKDAKKAMHTILSACIVGHNLKFDLAFITRWLNIKKVHIYSDTMVLAWLVDSSIRVGLDALALTFFNHEMISFSKTVKKGENFSCVLLEDATKYAAEDAIVTLKLFFHLQKLLKERGGKILSDLALTLEYPFINTLLAVEKSGIRLDINFLRNLKEKFKKELDNLVNDIYILADEKFNINSTKQLGIILFEKLKLPTVKKTKTGYSTDEKVLNALKGKHDIIDKLLEYRALFKLYSTYVDPLLTLALKDKDHIIHTSFLQTGTATGRLSSKNPNLQNIPVKSDNGKLIREAFIARDGKKLISLDYSQIELRLLAHYCQDPTLIKSFNSGKDIHLQTSLELFGKDAVNKRHIAKTVNFGLLYGMGANKLGQTLGIPNKEAKVIIENYFASFPTVKDFLSSIALQSEEKGFVQTLLGRRRWFNYKNASNMMKSALKREAVNTVFQGSAADLIKMSMNKIMTIIETENLDAKMLLQIHDELIFEVNQNEAETLALRFKNEMQSIFKLSIKLECSVNIGTNWGALK